jgi:fructokinase
VTAVDDWRGKTASRIGIDLGGTKIEGLLLGPDGAERMRHRIGAPRGDYAATIAAIKDLVARLDAAAEGPAPIGVGMPGSLSPATGLVQNSNSTWLNGRRLDADLNAALGRPLRFANDANCFALSEAVDGAGAGTHSVFGVILGTGCGGGIVVGGRIVNGPRGIGGEWGHNPLPWAGAEEHPGPLCWCGRHGCMEVWVSGPGLQEDHLRVAGETLTAIEIAARAAAGHPSASASLERHASRLARGLAHVVNILDPEVIVLGGGLSQLDQLYRVLPGLMAPHIFADEPTVDVRRPKWGDAGGARGAARLWNDDNQEECPRTTGGQ